MANAPQSFVLLLRCVTKCKEQTLCLLDLSVDMLCSFGVALPVNVIIAKQRIFPATSAVNPNDPTQSFFGLKLDGALGTRVGLKLEALWKPVADWSFGASYAPKTKLDAKNGKAEVNFTSIGLGVVP